MLIKIDNPSSELSWIVFETNAIVSITPEHTPDHCLVRLSNGRAFHLEKELLDKIIPHVPILNQV